jgi:hypothetical protein
LCLSVAKRPVLFADFDQTNERVSPEQAETLVQSVCDCFVKGTFLIHARPALSVTWMKNAVSPSLNAQGVRIKDKLLDWMLHDDLEATSFRAFKTSTSAS